MFAGKKSAQIREILISESAWEEMTCLFAPSLTVTRSVESQKYCQYPTWFVVKEQNIKIEPDETLMKVAMLEKERVHNNRMKRLGSI